MTTIYDAITADHEKHRALLDRIADTSGDSRARREAWKEFYYDVKSHAAAEEESFYSPLMEKIDGQDDARHSVAEHKELDDIMEELNTKDMSSPGWLARFKTLKHDYEHHMEEEEQDIFKTARQVMSDDSDGAIAHKFEKRKRLEREVVDEKAKESLNV